MVKENEGSLTKLNALYTSIYAHVLKVPGWGSHHRRRGIRILDMDLRQ